MNRTTFHKSLLGLADARGSRGIAARGKNVYGGTRMAPKSLEPKPWTNVNDALSPVKKEVYAKRAMQRGTPKRAQPKRAAIGRRLRLI